jgi:FMN phosphatase YigB (HAD superfamily)
VPSAPRARPAEAGASVLAAVRVVSFDFGNTLVPVDRAGLERVVARMARAVAARSGPFPVDAFLRLWAEERERQLAEALAERREPDLGERVRRVLARLRGVVPPADGRTWDEAALARLVDPEEAAVALEAYAAAFVALLPPRAGAAVVLERLSRTLRLAVVSNWPHAPTIDRYLAAQGWDRFAAAVVVSARVGAIKPDVAIFRAAEAALGLGAADRGRILHVGDDPLADVAGAKAAGWLAAHLHGRPEDSPLPVGEAGTGVAADLELGSLDELPPLLGA